MQTYFPPQNRNLTRLAAPSQVNDEHGLMRFEFVEAVVRLAIAKYGKGIVTHDVAEAVRKLLELNIIPRVKPQVGAAHGGRGPGKLSS